MGNNQCRSTSLNMFIFWFSIQSTPKILLLPKYIVFWLELTTPCVSYYIQFLSLQERGGFRWLGKKQKSLKQGEARLYKYYSSLRRSDQLPSNSDWVEITSRTMVRAALLVVKNKKSANTWKKRHDILTTAAADHKVGCSLVASEQPHEARAA